VRRLPELNFCLRITIGTRQQMDQIADLLANLTGGTNALA